MKRVLTIGAFIAFVATVFGQTAWTHPKGEGYFKLSQNFIIAGSFFNPNGEVIDITTTSVYVTGVYGEYGVSEGLTAMINAPVFVRSTINNKESTVDGFVIPGDEFNGIGDIWLGLKYGIVRNKPVVFAVSGQVKFPTGENVGGNSELLQSGDGAWGALGLAHVSYSFYPTPVYVSLYAGYQFRGEADLVYSSGTDRVNYDDAVRWGVEAGWSPSDNWQIALKVDNVVAAENGSGGGITGGSSIFGNRISYLAITPEVAYIFNNGLGVSVGVGTAAWGRNILAAPNFNAGVFYLLK